MMMMMMTQMTGDTNDAVCGEERFLTARQIIIYLLPTHAGCHVTGNRQ